MAINNKNKVVVVSGKSGGGKTTAARVLEDMGFFVVDNLPLLLLDGLLDIAEKNLKKMSQIALIIDARESEFLKFFEKKWQNIDSKKYQKRIIFLEAKPQTIIKRYQQTRRPHPLDKGKGIEEAIKEETLLLKAMKKNADDVIETDNLFPRDLQKLLKEIFFPKSCFTKVTFVSFGFKWGLPLNLDYCFDVRFLENPYYFPQMRNLTGKDKKVFEFVTKQEEATIFLRRIKGLVNFFYPLFKREGKSNLTVGIGCTGGKHRSVAIAIALKQSLDKKIPNISLEHRDITKNL